MFALLAASLLMAGCGGGGDGSPSADEKASDVELLNQALSQELTAVSGLEAGLPLLRGTALDLAEEFRAQQQEHVDALIKAVRGQGGKTDAEPGEIEVSEVRSAGDFYAFAYQLGNSTIASHMSAIPKLYGGHLRVLFASIVADEAQQLVLLRHALGGRPEELVPDAFETGASPAPGEASSND